MPTLAEITEGHSKRISQLAQRRDSRLQEAADTRDRRLRALPGAVKLYEAFDKQMSDARKKQVATDSKAEAARAGALQKISDTLRDALDQAHAVRRDADQAAFEKRRKAEEDAEHEFILALAAGPSRPSTEAQKIRAEKVARAKKDFDEALSAAQEQFRQARDAALLAESQAARDANRSFTNAARVNETSAKAARATAEQKLAKALAALPDAAAAFDAWKKAIAAIAADYRRDEAGEFERFHREMEALR